MADQTPNPDSSSPASPDYSHLAQAWQSFSDDRRAGLLKKMSPEQKRGLRSVLETHLGSSTAPTADLTSNPKGEGLYRLLPEAQQGYTDTSQQILVPFSKVPQAQSSGYHLHFDEEARYQKDFAHQGEGPTVLERFRNYLSTPNAPVQRIMPDGRAIKIDTNVLSDKDKAALRTVLGAPGYLKEVLNAAIHGKEDNNAALMDLIDPGYMPKNLYDSYQSDLKTYGPDVARDRLTGNLLGMGITAAATHGTVRATGALAEGLGEKILSAKGVIQEVAGVRPRVATELVKKTAEENKVEVERATGAAHEQVGRELGHQQAVRTKAEEIRTKEATEAAKQQAAHQKAVTKTEQANEAERQRVEAETSEAQKEYFRKQAEHQQQVQATEAENARLQAEYQRAVAEQEGLQTRLNETDRGAKVGLTALENRLHEEASAKYEALMPKLKSYEADPENIEAMVNKALDEIDPAVGKPPLLNKLETLSADNALNYENLNDFRSAIDSTLRKTQVPGSTYHIYRDIMEPVIIDEMNRIAGEHDLTAEADEARAFFRAYAEAFRDRTSPLRKIVKSPEAHGALNAMRGRQSFLARLRAFGPDGEKLAGQIENAIYDAQQNKAQFTKYGDIRVAAPKAPTLGKIPEFKEEPPEPARPEITPPPAPSQPQLTAGSPEERAAQQIAPPERVPGTEPELKQVGSEELTEANRNAYKKAVESLRNRGVWVFAGLPWLWVARDLLRFNFSAAGLNSVGAAISSVGAVAGLTMLTDYLERPEIVDFFSSPSEAQIKALGKLSPEQRSLVADGFENVIKVAKDKGIKISPLIAAYAAVNASAGKPGATLTGQQGQQPSQQPRQERQQETAPAMPEPQSKVVSPAATSPSDRAARAQVLQTYAQAVGQFDRAVSGKGLVASLAQFLSLPTPSNQPGIPAHVAPRLASQIATVAALSRPSRTDLATLSTLPQDQRKQVEEAIGQLAEEAHRQGKLPKPSPWLGIIKHEGSEEVAA